MSDSQRARELPLEVTQADRDIAAEYSKRFPELRLTEAFARHRSQAIADERAATLEEAAKVALNSRCHPQPRSKAAQYHERNVRAIIHDAIRALKSGEHSK